MAGVGLFWKKSTADWLLVADLFWEKSIAGWWLISQAKEQGVGCIVFSVIANPGDSISL
jgi:hypothetical protein